MFFTKCEHVLGPVKKYPVGIDQIYMCNSEVENEAVPSKFCSYPSTQSAVYTRMNGL
jgi:hypothetical protein